MARAPPTGGGDPDLVEFGIPVLDDRLDEADLTFPAERAAVRAALGDVEVPYDAHGRTVTLDAALEGVGDETFETRHELLDALHPVFEQYREGSAGGLVSRLRSLLPL